MPTGILAAAFSRRAEQLPQIAYDEPFIAREILLEDLEKNNVRGYVNSTVREILDDSVIIAIGDREEARLSVDSVVLALGAQPEDGLAAGSRPSSGFSGIRLAIGQRFEETKTGLGTDHCKYLLTSLFCGDIYVEK